MYGDVLVPLDGSPFSEHALPLACAVARATGSTLHLALVHTPLSIQTPDAVPVPLLAEWDGQNRDRERYYLDRRAGVCRDRGLRVDAQVVDGRVEEELCRLAEAADLVVMASHGRHGVQRVWLGSVTDAVVREAGKPVAVVRPGETADGEADDRVRGSEPRLRHVMAATAGFEADEAAVKHAAALTRALDGRLTLLSVVDVPDGFSSPYIPHAAKMVRGATERRQASAHRELRLIARQYPDLPIGARVWRDSDSARGILGAVRQLEPDLVVVGTHRKTALGRAILGSIADEVVRGSPAPVMVVPEAAGDDLSRPRRAYGPAVRRRAPRGARNPRTPHA